MHNYSPSALCGLRYCAIAKRRIQEAEQAFALFEPTVPEVQAQMFTEEQ